MQIQILLFGILRDIIGANLLNEEISKGMTLEDFKLELVKTYPKLKEFDNYTIAVNQSYAEKNYVLLNNDVVALIPPVSGG